MSCLQSTKNEKPADVRREKKLDGKKKKEKKNIAYYSGAVVIVGTVVKCHKIETPRKCTHYICTDTVLIVPKGYILIFCSTMPVLQSLIYTNPFVSESQRNYENPTALKISYNQTNNTFILHS